MNKNQVTMDSGILRDYMTEEEIVAAARASRNGNADIIFRALTALKNKNFKEGDFLIRINAKWDWDSDNNKKWQIEPFSESNATPRKYKIVYVDEFGIPFLRRVLFNGLLANEMFCMTNFDLDWVEFLIDPDSIDHILLSDDDDVFDPLLAYRKVKRESKKIK